LEKFSGQCLVARFKFPMFGHVQKKTPRLRGVLPASFDGSYTFFSLCHNKTTGVAIKMEE
jgi:hypothetical protein